MSEEDLELMVTLDDPGEDDLEEDTFHDPQAENTSQPGDVIVEYKSGGGLV